MSYSPLKILMRGSGKSLLISIFLSAIFIIQPSTLSASTQVSGVISKNTVWTLKNHPYLVDSDLHIYGNSADKTVTLTIEPGVEVRFGYNTRLVLGWSRHQKGCIVAKGTKKKPITFTAYNKEPGSWQGIYFARGAAAGKSILKHCIVEYGGYNQVGNIYIEEGSPTITRCTIRKGSGHGIHIFGYSSPKITRSTISHNQGDGIHAVRGDSTPEISGNTITKNNGHALAVRAHVVSRAIIQNRLGDNGKNSIRTVGTIRRGSHTWTARFPYFIDGDAAVYGETGKPAASLTLMPGTVLQFADGGGLKIGGSTGEKGVLVARSAGIKPITFTAASRKPGAWKGIRFADGAVDRKNIMEHCIVEYGGKQQDANIAIESCSPVITHCTIRDGSRHGIRVDNHIHSRPQITGSTITGNAGNGIHSEGDKSMPVISGNTLLKNNGCPILIGVQAVGGIEDNNKIRKNGNNNIYVRPGRLQGNHTWNVRHPLLISGYVDVLSERDTPPASLELMPGTVLQFADYAHLKIGEYHGKKGCFLQKGTPITQSSLPPCLKNRVPGRESSFPTAQWMERIS